MVEDVLRKGEIAVATLRKPFVLDDRNWRQIAEVLHAPVQCASDPAATTMQMRVGLDAFLRNDEMTNVQAVTMRMDDADLQEAAQEGIPGLVNMNTGVDSLEGIHEKIDCRTPCSTILL
ncbi:hypothetical protein AZE42_06710 [Rhizopogon vesiculosus]|uniref:Uncharacterized protein n=1 Tax=Rhizopogon vesiculosus TaxID=180088 RepID=A0A1J8R7E8_9AGAM|nr:hypothetical protein AZE42_06710 [Rhizopogon vesiculosus]